MPEIPDPTTATEEIPDVDLPGTWSHSDYLGGPPSSWPVRNGVCTGCGSAVLDGEHVRSDLPPCWGH